ncbi:MAG TPA: VOC family protein [Terriglobales bacterium]|nr:VOC family protein [Terriglobales bacterium]
MPDFSFHSIDHVQLAMPPGEEATARHFYADLLGMREIPKPAPLASRGGCWFASESVQLHLGVEQDFRPARKAHPAIRVSGYAALLAKLKATGVEVIDADDLPGVQRSHIFDPFGNRIELISA